MFLCLTNIGPLVVSGISMNHIHLKYGEKDLLVASSPSHQDIRAHPLVSKSLAPKPTTLPALPIDIPSPHLFQAVTKSTMPWVQRMSSQVGGGLRDDACDHYSDVIYMWIKPRGKNSPSKEVWLLSSHCSVGTCHPNPTASAKKLLHTQVYAYLCTLTCVCTVYCIAKAITDSCSFFKYVINVGWFPNTQLAHVSISRFDRS